MTPRTITRRWRPISAGVAVFLLGCSASGNGTTGAFNPLGTDDPGGTLCKELYARYMDGATPPPEPGAHRLIVRIRPRRWYAPFA